MAHSFRVECWLSRFGRFSRRWSQVGLPVDRWRVQHKSCYFTLTDPLGVFPIHSSSLVLGADDVLDGMARCDSTDSCHLPPLHCAATTSPRHENTPGWDQKASERLVFFIDGLPPRLPPPDQKNR